MITRYAGSVWHTDFANVAQYNLKFGYFVIQEIQVMNVLLKKLQRWTPAESGHLLFAPQTPHKRQCISADELEYLYHLTQRICTKVLTETLLYHQVNHKSIILNNQHQLSFAIYLVCVGFSIRLLNSRRG